MGPRDLQRLQDYVDGELDDASRLELEHRFADDPEWAEALGRFKTEQTFLKSVFAADEVELESLAMLEIPVTGRSASAGFKARAESGLNSKRAERAAGLRRQPSNLGLWVLSGVGVAAVAGLFLSLMLHSPVEAPGNRDAADWKVAESQKSEGDSTVGPENLPMAADLEKALGDLADRIADKKGVDQEEAVSEMAAQINTHGRPAFDWLVRQSVSGAGESRDEGYRKVYRRLTHPAVAWVRSFPETNRIYTIRAESDVLIFAHYGGLQALDIREGNLKWQKKGSYSPQAFAATKGMVVAGMYGGVIEAFRAEDGDFLWTNNDLARDRVQVGAVTCLFADPKGSRFVVGTDRGTVLVLDQKNGKEIWSRQGTTSEFGTGGIAGVSLNERVGAYMVSVSNRGVVAMKTESGEPMWSFKGQAMHAPNSGSSDEVCVAGLSDRGGTVYALDARKGQLRWASQPNVHTIVGSPDYDSSAHVVIAQSGSRIFGIHSHSGKLQWRKTLFSGWNGRGFTVHEGMIYTTAGSGRLIALEASNGQPAWEMEMAPEFGAALRSPGQDKPADAAGIMVSTSYGVLGQPIVKKQMLYVTGSGGFVAALNLPAFAASERREQSGLWGER